MLARRCDHNRSGFLVSRLVRDQIRHWWLRVSAGGISSSDVLILGQRGDVVT